VFLGFVDVFKSTWGASHYSRTWGGRLSLSMCVPSALSPDSRSRNTESVMSFDYIEVHYKQKRQNSSLSYKSPIRFLDD